MFFGAYVGLAIGVLGVQPVPFARKLRRLLHRAAHDRGALVEAPVCFLKDARDAGSRTRDQATHAAAQARPRGAGHAASGGFNAGETIIKHVSNSSLDHPLIHLPTIAGIDFSVTKHVFMLWLVAAVVFLIVTTVVRRYLKSGRPVPTGFMNALEAVVRVRARRDRAAQRRPQVGQHLDAADADVLRLHSLRERDRPDPDLRRRRRWSITTCCTRRRTRS